MTAEERRIEDLEFYANPSNFTFECAACGKLHLRQTGRVCPCGVRFPDRFREVIYRA